MKPETNVRAAQLVSLFGENGWLPHGAMFTWVNGRWYRVEVKAMSDDFVSEEGMTDPIDRLVAIADELLPSGS